MKPSRVIVRVLMAWVALLVARMIAGAIIPIKVSMPGNLLIWAATANFLTAAALAFAGMRSDWRGWRLGLALCAIPLAIDLIDSIEGIVYLKIPGLDWQRILLQFIVAYALLVPLWTLIFGKNSDAVQANYSPLRSRSLGQKLWRFIVSDFAYLFLYLIAGMIIFPFVKSFYATQTLPSLGELVSLQLFLRGPLFVSICLLLVRMMGLPRAAGALAVGTVFAIVSGVAPLMVPNPFFPDSVRWVHFCEVTGSNFLFATLVGWMWGVPKSVTSWSMNANELDGRQKMSS